MFQYCFTLREAKSIIVDQEHTHKYGSLKSALERYNSKFSKIVRSEGGVNTDEKFAEYNKLCKDLMGLMTMYIPEMLKDCVDKNILIK